LVDPTLQTVDSGTSATITITPDTGYHIASVTDNGNAATIANPYVISNVTASHLVVVTFAADEPLEPVATAAEEIQKPAPAPSPVRELKIIPDRVKQGGIVNVFAEATNTGPETSSYSLVLNVRDTAECAKEITLGSALFSGGELLNETESRQSTKQAIEVEPPDEPVLVPCLECSKCGTVNPYDTISCVRCRASMRIYGRPME